MSAVEHANLAEALAAFQTELPTIKKGNEAKVKSERTGVEYKYSYADLADISPLVLPLLGKHGLAWTTQPTLLNEDFVLHYSLAHESGQEIEGIYPLPASTTPPQQMGSAITYARRYTLCAVTGVAPGGDDDDAQEAQTATRAPRQRQEKPTPKPPEPPAATVDWAAQIIDASTVEQLRDVYQLVEQSGELGARFGAEHRDHLLTATRFFGLEDPGPDVSVQAVLGAVRRALEVRQAQEHVAPPEDEAPMALGEPVAEWPTATPGGES